MICEEILPALPDGIRLPKADNPEMVERLDTLLTEQEEKLGLDIGHFKIIPSIESAQGVLNCVETAKASPRLVALAFGAEDYTASMEIDRTKTGRGAVLGPQPGGLGRQGRRASRPSTRSSRM